MRRDLFSILIRREVLIHVSNREVVTAVMSETISNSNERTYGPNRTVGVGRLQTHEHLEVHAY